MRYRSAVVVSSISDAAAALRNSLPVVDAAHPRGVTFLFPGYGLQQQGMGRHLHEQSAVFRAELDRGAALVLAADGPDIAPYLLEEAPDADCVSVDVRTTLPALFVFTHAVTVTLERAGLRASTLIGCSLGEFVAAVAGGVMSFEDAVKLVVASSKAAFNVPAGAMLTALCSESEARSIVAPGVSIAALHAEEVVGLSGPIAAIEETRVRLGVKGFATRPVASDRAFHSPMFESVAQGLERQLTGIVLSGPKRRIVSSVSGTQLTTSQAKDPSYWAHILSRPVRFADALEQLGGGGHLVVEAGSGTSLTALALVHPSMRGADAIASLPSGGTDRRALGQLYEAVAQGWLQGSVSEVVTSRFGPRAILPTYSFERTRHWLTASTAALGKSELLDGPVTAMARRLEAMGADELPDRLGALKELIERQITLMRSQLQLISTAEARLPRSDVKSDGET